MTDTIFLPTLPDNAFFDLPDGLELPGSPDDFRFQVFALSKLCKRAESEEAAGRIMLALGQHGSWKAIRVRALLNQLSTEQEAHNHGRRGEYVGFSQLMFPDGIRRVLIVGVFELIDAGMIMHAGEGEDEIIWPTPEFVDWFEPYRVNQAR